MQNRAVSMQALFENSDELITENNGINVVNDCYFMDWDCLDRTLKKKALGLIKKLSFFENEYLVRKEDLVMFEHGVNVGRDYTRILVLRKENSSASIIGSFHFLLKPNDNLFAFCSGDHHEFRDERPTDFYQYESWQEMQKAMRYDLRLRSSMRNIFM